MSDSAGVAWRPGVAQGAYPQRKSEKAPAFARFVRSAVGLLTVPSRVSGARVAAFARTVHEAGKGMEDLDEAGLDRVLDEVRISLRRSGLDPELLPRAFALVREAARRTLGTPHYDVQLYGGWVMAREGLAELETGEGKTLTATLPASVAALASIPVHVITSNDYLVERDAESMQPLYERLGLSVGTVVESEPDTDVRRAAYACDIVYVTNKQVAFDYLRDRMAGGGESALASELTRADDRASPTVLRGLCFAIVDEADSVLVDDAVTPLILSRPGAAADEETVRTALRLAQNLKEDDYWLDTRRRQVGLTEEGHAHLEELGKSLRGPLAGERRREEWVERALSALHLYERDKNYLVHEDAIQIIDLPTGRRSPDRAFEGGMHALIEAKEGLELSPQRETVDRISYQTFFGRYLRLAGMTGTAREVARELWSVYQLRTIAVPTRLPTQRLALGLHVFAREEAKWKAVVARVRKLHDRGRPVLLGTASVEASEQLGELLEAAGLAPEVLNARQDKVEADIISRAGELGRITVATRMAGRGTDIRLGEGVREAGGLAVVATELGDAGRIDRQLFGRCGRQAAPGSFEQLVSFEDRIIDSHVPNWLRQLCSGPSLLVRLGGILTRLAQRSEERQSALARKRLLEQEGNLEKLLAFAGRR